MRVLHTDIAEVEIIEPELHGDARGYFCETFQADEFNRRVRPVTFVQDNESRSHRGVIRGLHWQYPPAAQSKLVRVVEGAVLDVAVDIRPQSPTFGKHVAVELTAENHRQLFIPRGFAHGFAVLSETALFQYKVDNFYEPDREGGIAYNSPELGIDWRIPEAERELSQKDTRYWGFDSAYYAGQFRTFNYHWPQYPEQQ